MKNSFYVLLPSNACPLTQPDNIAANYLIDVENSLTFDDEDWEVALTEFSLIPSLIRKPYHFVYEYKERYQNKFVLTFQDDRFSMTAVNTDANNVISFVDDVSFHIGRTTQWKLEIQAKQPFTIVFNSPIESRLFGFENLISTSDGNVLIADYEFTFKYTAQAPVTIIYNVTEELNFDEYSLPPTNVEMVTNFKVNWSKLFYEFKLDSRGYINFVLSDDIQMIKFDPRLSEILGLDGTLKYMNDNGKLHVPTTQLRKSNTFNQLLIYSSIVEPIIVGNSRVPLLRSVWIQSSYMVGDVLFENVDYPMYLPISSKSINNIQVQIRSDSGDFIPFSSGSKTNITLHFRKI